MEAPFGRGRKTGWIDGRVGERHDDGLEWLLGAQCVEAISVPAREALCHVVRQHPSDGGVQLRRRRDRPELLAGET